jgi:predicted NBD/HSP70 family sugar kinase
MSEREQRKQNKKSVLGKVFSVLKQTWKACKQDHALGIGLIAVSIIRNGTMLQQVTFYNWVNSFTIGLDPKLEPKQAKAIWQ